MALVLYVVLILAGLILKNSKWLYLLMSAFLFTLLAFRTGGADYGVYASRFRWYSEFSYFTECLFTFYISIFHKLHLSFDAFLRVSALLCMIVPFVFIYSESDYPCRVLSLYMLYSFPVDGVQIRSTLAFGIVLVGFLFLMRNSRKSEIVYFACVLIAAFLHAASILYVVFLPINRISMRKLPLQMLGIFLAELILLFLMKNTLFKNLSKERFEIIHYLISHAANDDYRVFVYITKSLIMFSAESVLLLLYQRDYFVDTEENISKLEFVNKLNFLTLLLIPLYFLSVDLYRLQRYLMIFSLVVIWGTRIRGSRKTKLMYFTVSLLGFGLIYDLFMYRSTDYITTILSLLTGNSVL